MLRNQSIEEIFDGRFYGPDDMVPAGCHDCAGCSACCRNTGDSIILDPWDMYMLARGTGKSFTDMIEKEIEIRLVDGLILPNLMQHHDETADSSSPADSSCPCAGQPAAPADVPGCQDSSDCCPFLTDAGRCGIHPYRPGLCRLYPLGRYYTEDSFRYILQKDECADREKYPVLLRDWLGIPDLAEYEQYILEWHDFIRRAGAVMPMLTERSRDSVARYILQVFFVKPYDIEKSFYDQFYMRMSVCAGALEKIL